MLLSAQMLFYNKFCICSDHMRLVSKIKVASLGLQAYFGKTSLNWSWCGYFALKSRLTNSELIICMEQKADKRCSMWFSLLYLVQKVDNCAELKPAHGLKKTKKTLSFPFCGPFLLSLSSIFVTFFPKYTLLLYF